jgi:mRNA interferase RelE/StbE
VSAEDQPYELVVAGPAARAIAAELPESVAAAVIDLITGPLLASPQRVGKPLRHELEGIWSARRGTFRILYRIDAANREVVVLRIEHRSSAYRRR